mmetsp:Transcript_23152/g.33176  ORF Transcript_23152/g.33176 Transcript_23152/m.33176 type:complete len:103 (-) Transcript_23152:874-1182(-)
MSWIAFLTAMRNGINDRTQGASPTVVSSIPPPRRQRRRSTASSSSNQKTTSTGSRTVFTPEFSLLKYQQNRRKIWSYELELERTRNCQATTTTLSIARYRYF